MTQRIFIAITLPGAVQEEIGNLLIKLNKFSWPVKWESPAKLHITLRFLGDLEEEEVNKIQTIVEKVIRQTRSFNLAIKGFVAYPNFKFPKVIGLKIIESKELFEIQSIISHAIVERGIGKPEEYPFSGHITLGRLTPTYANFRALSAINFTTSFKISSVELMASVLKPTGSEYTIISSCPFQL